MCIYTDHNSFYRCDIFTIFDQMVRKLCAHFAKKMFTVPTRVDKASHYFSSELERITTDVSALKQAR